MTNTAVVKTSNSFVAIIRGTFKMLSVLFVTIVLAVTFSIISKAYFKSIHETKVVELKQQVAKLDMENKRLAASLNNALVPEASVTEAFDNHVIEPGKRVATAYVVSPAVALYEYAQNQF